MSEFEREIQLYVDNELPDLVEGFLGAKKIREGASSEVYKIFTEDGKFIFKAIEALEIQGEVELMKKRKEKGINTPEIIDWGFIDGVKSGSYYLMEYIDAEKSGVSTDFDAPTYHRMLGNILQNMHQEKVEGYGTILFHDGVFRGKYDSYQEYFDAKYGVRRIGSVLDILDIDHDDYDAKIKKAIQTGEACDMVICHNDLHYHNTFGNEEIQVIDPNPVADNPIMDLARTISHMLTKNQINNVDSLLSGYHTVVNKRDLLDMIYFRTLKSLHFKLQEKIIDNEEASKRYKKFEKEYDLLQEKWAGEL